jgi:hypothetical protein
MWRSSRCVEQHRQPVERALWGDLRGVVMSRHASAGSTGSVRRTPISHPTSFVRPGGRSLRFAIGVSCQK